MIENQIVHGDAIGMMHLIRDDSVDLIVTSPPYNLGMEYSMGKGRPKYDDAVAWSKYFKWCEQWLRECYRILKPDGRMCLNHYLSCGSSAMGRAAPLMRLNSIAEDIGFKHHGVAIWNDATVSRHTAWGSWLSASAPYINSPYEGILILYKNKWKKINRGVSTIGKEQFIDGVHGVWKLKSVRRTTHPAPFDNGLPNMCINLLSYYGDLVVDPFAGEGTTCVEAALLGRRWIGIDLSPRYVRTANMRLRRALKNGSDARPRKKRSKGKAAGKDQRVSGQRRHKRLGGRLPRKHQGSTDQRRSR